MKRRIGCILLAILLALSSVAFAHSGRTDSNGGHRDNQNKSGLGYYHYHCGGYPAHLHPGGVCPYKSGGSTKPTAKPTTKPTPKPTSRPTVMPTQKPIPKPTSTPATAGIPAIFGANKAVLLALFEVDNVDLILGKTNCSNVNVRGKATTDSKRVDKIAKKGTVVIVLETIQKGNAEAWYKIRLDAGTTAYVSSKLIDIIDTDEFMESLN